MDSSSHYLTTLRPVPPDRDAVSALAVITCFYNPCGYRSPLVNYGRFADALDAMNVTLFTAELAFDDRPFVLNRPNCFRYRTRHVMWHKERLLNLVLQHVPRRYDKIAWVDADILFQNRDWPQETVSVLGHYPVAQLFEQAIQLNPHAVPIATKTGIAYTVTHSTSHGYQFGKMHPGYAWAARRELLEEYGFFDTSICGGGDSLMKCALYGWWHHGMIRIYPPAMQRALEDWGRPLWNDVGGRIGYVPGRIQHLWHGKEANRQYMERVSWLRQARFDPNTDLRQGSEGLLEWSNEDHWLPKKIRQYFFDRREDG